MSLSEIYEKEYLQQQVLSSLHYLLHFDWLIYQQITASQGIQMSNFLLILRKDYIVIFRWLTRQVFISAFNLGIE